MTPNKFTIQNIYLEALSYREDLCQIVVTVSVDAKHWAKCSKTGHLGTLYGIDISNAVHAINSNIPAWKPSVSAARRAKNGVKAVVMHYAVETSKAKAMGLPCIGNSLIPEYGARVSLYDQRDHSATLRVVGGSHV